ncbi:hypothetical protein, partial [Streptomyces zaomyceticus]|uniref:hypothetical protein n=1 Tax=Streptomyces zaomyceticus TaxID=68286 RepID=UPI0036BD8C69
MAKVAHTLLSTVWPVALSSPGALERFQDVVREVILHTSEPEAEVTSEHVTQLFSLAATAKQESEWALENVYSLAAYHLILKTGIYDGPVETVTENDKSVVFRQWQFPHGVDLLKLGRTYVEEADGFMTPVGAPWPDAEYYVLGLAPNEQGKLTIESHEAPVEVLLYVAEHDPKRRHDTAIILAVPGAGEAQNDPALWALHSRTGVRVWSPLAGGAYLEVNENERGFSYCALVDQQFGNVVTWMETGKPPSEGGEVGKSEAVPADIEAAAEGESVVRVFTDITGTVRFTVHDVVRRPVMSADGERVIGVSTTPEEDTPLVRGDALHGIDGVDELMVFDEASGGSVSTPLDPTPGAVLVYAGRGGNVLLRLRGERDIELFREEAALLFGEMPELIHLAKRLRREEFTKETALLLLDGNIPEEGAINHMVDPPDMGRMISAVVDVRLHHGMNHVLMEVRERGKIRARPRSRTGRDSEPIMREVSPWGMTRFFGGKWENADDLASFSMMLRLVGEMRKFAGPRGWEFKDMNPTSFAKLVCREYKDTRPWASGLSAVQLRPILVEEVLAEAGENGSLGLHTFLRIPLLRGIDEVPVSGELAEGGPGVPFGPVESRRLLARLVRTGLSNQARLDFINALQAVYHIIPPGYHRLEDPEKRIRAYLDRALAHATAPDEQEQTAGNKPYRRIIQLISDAQKAGRAGSDAALTAYLLQRGGLFDRTPL